MVAQDPALDVTVVYARLAAAMCPAMAVLDVLAREVRLVGTTVLFLLAAPRFARRMEVVWRLIGTTLAVRHANTTI